MSNEHVSFPQQPAVDERLIMPDTRYEVIDGEVVYVSPALEPHGTHHSKLQALVEAYAADGYSVACDMLTRTSDKGDMAPDASIYPSARDPKTGGRQLEELAFEVVSTETLAHAGREARSLIERGVRRVFAIDVERRRGLEWSQATSGWEILGLDAEIEDKALVLPLPVHDLVAAGKADDAVARALLAKGNAVLTAALDATRSEGRAEGKAEAVLAVLASRGIAVSADERRAILSAGQPDAMLAKVATCASAQQLLEQLNR